MAFLAIPLLIVILVALCIRLKNTGKLKKFPIVGVANGIESKHKELGKWISKQTNSKKRNGFTRLNQDSNDEAESLNNPKSSKLNSYSDSDSDSEVEIQLPTISKA